MKKSVLQLSPYPTCLVLRTFLEDKQAHKHLDSTTLATTSLLENNIIVVDFDLSPQRRKDKQLLQATAVHEAVHVMQFVQKVIDAPLDMESAAYLVQRVFTFISASVTKALQRRK